MSTMDYVFRLRSDTRGTVVLTSDPFDVREWDLRAASRDEKETDNALELRLKDDSVANNLDEVRTLNLMLKDAHDRNRKKDKRIDPVYAEWMESAGGTVWRSEVMTAKADWLEDALEYGYWINDTQFADLEFTRLNYWEGPEAQVPLTNPNGTAEIGDSYVSNVNDGAGVAPYMRYNYLKVDGTAIVGDLSGGTRLEITNPFDGGAPRLAYVWIGQNYTNPETFDHWYECEEATHSGTAVASSGYSGGTAISLNVPDSAETQIFKWSISGAQLNAAAGGYFKAMLRFAGTPNRSIRYRLKIQYSSTDLWQTELITLDDNYAILIRDLTTFQLPPWLPGETGLEALDLILFAYQTTGSSIPQSYDALMLMPVDGWRALQYIGYGTPLNYRIVDDGINDVLYMDNGSGSNKLGIYLGYGQPITFKPGFDQRIYFQLHSWQANTAEASRFVTLKMYYRPRRLTI